MYDTVELAKQKLFGTICYYDNKSVYVKDVTVGYEDPNKPVAEIYVRLCYLDVVLKPSSVSKSFQIKLSDPKFQYMEYNVGYLNSNGYAVWYYRVPFRQWKQGLHRSQFNLRDKSDLMKHYGHDSYDNFGANEFTAAMLENRYPVFQEAVDILNKPDHKKVAFHKDFAVYRDGFRGDYMIEHKGYPTAFGSKNGVFTCADKMTWLRETIQEMNIKVA